MSASGENLVLRQHRRNFEIWIVILLKRLRECLPKLFDTFEAALAGLQLSPFAHERLLTLADERGIEDIDERMLEQEAPRNSRDDERRLR